MIVLDGVDGQVLAHATPALMRDWALPRSAFATVAAAAPFGMMIGGILGGLVGDRFGRRVALVGSGLTFGVLTLVAALADSLPALGVLRFFAGIGLGGAMPNAAAIVAEYVPRRHRPVAITATIVCIPLGGFLGGLLAGQLVPAYGWRMLFVVGGLFPILLAASLLRLLPESPRFLASRPHLWPELRATLRRIGQPVDDSAEFAEAGSPANARAAGGVSDLLAPALRRDTLSLMTAFASCLLAIWTGFLWIPAMLTDPVAGFSQADASYALSLFNFGGIAGALLGAFAIQRFGSRAALTAMAMATAAAAAVMAATPLEAAARVGAFAAFTLTGALMNAVQTTMYALAAHVYPTAIRGTGVGATVAVGRAGNVSASYVGSWALSAGGPALFFGVWAAAMLVVSGALAAITRHIPPSETRR